MLMCHNKLQILLRERYEGEKNRINILSLSFYIFYICYRSQTVPFYKTSISNTICKPASIYKKSDIFNREIDRIESLTTNRNGFSVFNIGLAECYYFQLSNICLSYYQQTIPLSSYLNYSTEAKKEFYHNNTVDVRIHIQLQRNSNVCTQAHTCSHFNFKQNELK